MDGSRIILAAHRGDRKKYPENTMPAFISAYEHGVDMIETDVHMTSNGHLILMHDRNALRTTGVDRNIDQMTIDDIRRLDASYERREDHSGIGVPTVEEYAEWISKTELLTNWELKDYPSVVGESHAFECIDKLLEIIERYGLQAKSMVNSFSAGNLEYICKKAGHSMPIHGQGIYKSPRSNDTSSIPAEELFDWCCLYPTEKGKKPIDAPENFLYCKEHGIIPCVCIPDTAEDYSKAIELGCKMFTSNDIYAADRILHELNVR